MEGENHRQKEEPYQAVKSVWHYPYCVEEIWIYGDSFKSALVAVVPNEENAMKWEEQNHQNGSFVDLCSINPLKNHILLELKCTAERNKVSGAIVEIKLQSASTRQIAKALQEAQELFDQIPQRDVVSWNIVLSGFCDTGNPKSAHQKILRHGPTPDELNFSVLTCTFCSSDHSVLIPQLHGLVIHLRGLNIYLGSALMRAYVSLPDCGSFLRVFDEISVKDVAPCNVLILGYMKIGSMHEAKRAFFMMPVRIAYSWSIMIRGFVQYDKFLEALDMFHLMMTTGTRPNHYTYTLSSVLDACAVDMYGKCGDIDSAFRVFESMSAKNLVTWNSIMGGYGRHGLASRALDEFERMVNSGMAPDEISFIKCMEEWWNKEKNNFLTPYTKHRMRAVMEHYSCMVGPYGRAGQLDKAEELITPTY